MVQNVHGLAQSFLVGQLSYLVECLHLLQLPELQHYVALEPVCQLILDDGVGGKRHRTLSQEHIDVSDGRLNLWSFRYFKWSWCRWNADVLLGAAGPAIFRVRNQKLSALKRILVLHLGRERIVFFIIFRKHL